MRLEEAKTAWRAKKVQVLIDNDDVPDSMTNFVELERVEDVLESASIPTRVYVDGRVYKIKLRKRVERKEYRKLMKKLEELGKAWWDKRERVIKLMRYEEVAEPAGETMEVEEIIIGAGGKA